MCLSLALFLNVSSYAQVDKIINGVSLVLEQDVLIGFTGLNSDRNYTQGFGISLTSSRLSTHLDSLFYLRRKPKYYYNLPTKIAIQLAGFTPDELRDSLPIIGDRPYSTVIFLSLQDFRVDQENYRSRSWSFYGGLLGLPNAAKNIQTAIHKPMNDNNTKPPYNPEGWHNQISNGGEPTALISYSIKWLINSASLEQEAIQNNSSRNHGFRSQLTHSINLDLLYITQFTYGLDYRFGKINLRNWYQNVGWEMDPIGVIGTDIDTNKLNYFYQEHPELELYGFVGIKSGLMLYNASLHGQFNSTEYRLPYKDTGFFTNTGRVGVAVDWKKLGISIYLAWKSSEIMTKYARIHSWGGFTITGKW